MILVVDFSGMVPSAIQALPHVVKALIPDIAESIRTEIVRLAQEGLKTTTDDYVQGVLPVKYHFSTGRLPASGEITVATITLVGWLPNAIEHGMPLLDLLPYLVRGRNARMGKSGPYNIVPFRHGAPDAGGRNFPAMGSQHAKAGMMSRDAAAAMAKDIHRQAKSLKATKGHSSTGTQWGGRLAAGFSPKLKTHHTTDIHHNMARVVQTYKKAKGTQYATFRTASTKQAGAKWIHPGIEPREFFKKGAAYADRIIPFLFSQAMRGAVGGSQ